MGLWGAKYVCTWPINQSQIDLHHILDYQIGEGLILKKWLVSEVKMFLIYHRALIM